MSARKISLGEFIAQLPATRGERPRFLVWLGAGASVASGIPTASQIVRKRLVKLLGQPEDIPDPLLRRLAHSRLPWFKPGAKSEYCLVMEHSFVNPVLRQDFVHDLIRSARVSSGYLHLGRLLHEGVFDTVITTNFDYLVAQSFYRISTLPLVEINDPVQFKGLP